MIEFKVRLKALGLSTVGWAHPAVLGADIVFARRSLTEEGEDEPYVPGSSLKGALRSAASRIATSYGFTSCGEVRPEAIKEAHRGSVCDVCSLFGTPESGSPSPLTVTDLSLVEPAKLMGRTQLVLVTRVGIEDESQRAAKGILYTSEHLIPGAEFEGRVTIYDAETRLLGLLLLSMAELRLGRFGRRSLMDLMISRTEPLEKALHETCWLNLINDLKRWVWREIL